MKSAKKKADAIFKKQKERPREPDLLQDSIYSQFSFQRTIVSNGKIKTNKDNNGEEEDEERTDHK